MHLLLHPLGVRAHCPTSTTQVKELLLHKLKWDISILSSFFNPLVVELILRLEHNVIGHHNALMWMHLNDTYPSTKTLYKALIPSDVEKGSGFDI